MSLSAPTGDLVIARSLLPPAVNPQARLADALAAQAVDNLTRDGARFRFRHRTGFHAGVPRPGGNSWIFDGIESGEFVLFVSPDDLLVHYRLSRGSGFWLMLSVMIAIGVTIALADGATATGLLFSLFGLALLAIARARSHRRVRRWLHEVLTNDVLPTPKSMATPTVD